MWRKFILRAQALNKKVAAISQSIFCRVGFIPFESSRSYSSRLANPLRPGGSHEKHAFEAPNYFKAPLLIGDRSHAGVAVGDAVPINSSQAAVDYEDDRVKSQYIYTDDYV